MRSVHCSAPCKRAGWTDRARIKQRALVAWQNGSFGEAIASKLPQISGRLDSVCSFRTPHHRGAAGHRDVLIRDHRAQDDALVSSPDHVPQHASLRERRRIERVFKRSHGLPLVTRQLLHRACFGDVFVRLLADRLRQAVPSLTCVVVSPVLAGHQAVVSLGDGLVDWRRRSTYAATAREQARNTP